MKVAHLVESYFPATGGMQEVVRKLSHEMVNSGHEVYVITSRDSLREDFYDQGVNIVEFDVEGNFALGYRGGEIQSYKEYLRKSSFDIVVVFAAQQWSCDIFLEIIDEVPGKKVFVPTGFSGLRDNIYREYYVKMKKWMIKFDHCIFLSSNYRDINFYRELGGVKFQVIPNGASEEEFEKQYSFDLRKFYSIPSSNLILLFVGSHTGVKGHAEAIKIFSKCKNKNITLLMIGNVLSRKSFLITFFKVKLFNIFNLSKKIILSKLPRDYTVASFKQSDLFFFPSNIECSPIVLFESCAAKLPFLATDVGNSLEIADWTGGGVILPTDFDEMGFSRARIKDSAITLGYFIENRHERAKLAEAGYKSWKENFTWELIAKKYLNLYEQLLKKN